MNLRIGSLQLSARNHAVHVMFLILHRGRAGIGFFLSPSFQDAAAFLVRTTSLCAESGQSIISSVSGRIFAQPIRFRREVRSHPIVVVSIPSEVHSRIERKFVQLCA